MVNLEDTILKYSPNITEEIFNRIIKKVESRKYQQYKDGTGNDYKGFQYYGSLKFLYNVWQTAVYRPTDNHVTLEQILEIENFPFSIGETILCVELHKWSSSLSVQNPMEECIGKKVTISKIKKEDDYFSFSATYNGKEYGFCIDSDNIYERLSKNSECSEVTSILVYVPKI